MAAGGGIGGSVEPDTEFRMAQQHQRQAAIMGVPASGGFGFRGTRDGLSQRPPQRPQHYVDATEFGRQTGMVDAGGYPATDGDGERVDDTAVDTAVKFKTKVQGAPTRVVSRAVAPGVGGICTSISHCCCDGVGVWS